MFMNRQFLAPAIVALGILAASVAYAGRQESAAVDAAIDAAKEWLALVDASEFETSWERSALILQNAVSAPEWEVSLTAARLPFGELISRELLFAEFKKTLPGAPDGQYVVIQYRTEFEKKQAAVETVTPMFEAGNWKVSGYYIK
jgi:hypothetical protein